jgi:hypothetical protein
MRGPLRGEEMESTAQGHCQCASVQYEVRGALRAVIYCHCNMCRRISGHFVAATACDREDLVLKSSATLQWYQSSATARRGFCSRCGSNLFWDPVGESRICIMAGSLDPPTGLIAKGHIFVAEAGDYYRIDDGLPQSALWGQPLEI